MLSKPLGEYNIINQRIKREKVKIGPGTWLTGDDSKVIFWESLPNSNEISDLIIGKYCSISNNCNFFLGGNHRSDWFSQHLLGGKSETLGDEIISKGDIIIGNDVWIGYGATILSGTNIPDGCIVGAMSVVSGHFEPYDIIIGNPCKAIKKRFDKEVIDILLDLKWWDLTTEEINKYSSVLKSSDLNNLKDVLNYIRSDKN
jgi:acetyltransferase-like isoleucine patch superfamily enzyme